MSTPSNFSTTWQRTLGNLVEPHKQTIIHGLEFMVNAFDPKDAVSQYLCAKSQTRPANWRSHKQPDHDRPLPVPRSTHPGGRGEVGITYVLLRSQGVDM